MIGLDTNVLVRYLTQDDPDQAKAANQLIESQCTAEDPGLVSQVVLCELVWVLRSAYACGQDTITRILERILTAAELKVTDEEVAWRALRAYQQGGAEFPDYSILFSNREAGCTLTYSFDRKLARHPEAEIPGT